MTETEILFYLDIPSYPSAERPFAVRVTNTRQSLNEYIEALQKALQEATELRDKLHPSENGGGQGNLSFHPTARPISTR